MRNIFSKRKIKRSRRMPKQLHSMWNAIDSFSSQIQESEFMEEMIRRRAAHVPHGVMGRIDCATLYGLVRWHRPTVTVESGGYLGMSSAFILKALADEGLTDAKLYSIEFNKACPHGVLVPDELRSGFIPVNADVKDLVKGDQLPGTLDMFLHDSSHRYRHMLWEFSRILEATARRWTACLARRSFQRSLFRICHEDIRARQARLAGSRSCDPL